MARFPSPVGKFEPVFKSDNREHVILGSGLLEGEGGGNAVFFFFFFPLGQRGTSLANGTNRDKVGRNGIEVAGDLRGLK